MAEQKETIGSSGLIFNEVRQQINRGYVTLYLNEDRIGNTAYPIQLTEEGHIYVPEQTLEDALTCQIYWQGTDLYVRNSRHTVCIDTLENNLYERGEVIASEVSIKKAGERVYLPLEPIAEAFAAEVVWDPAKYRVQLVQEERAIASLPDYYDYRMEGRQSVVKDQGEIGVCWADAGTTALESALLPSEQTELSVDHMSAHNSFGLTEEEGGNELITLAYLSAWQGPVTEAQDPFDDGVSPDGLEPAYHIQEARVSEANDMETIKKQVYCCGGVESAIYFDLEYIGDYSAYYNETESAWCYTGKELANHSIVIIGWDDTYSASNFTKPVKGDGAYICQNSWGTEFGMEGVFYVSYYDTSIGSSNVVYSAVENTGNFDTIYQTDLTGWSGSVGFEEMDSGWVANIYRAGEDEQLEAIGFFACGDNTEYAVYVLTDPDEIKALRSGDTSDLEVFENTSAAVDEKEGRSLQKGDTVQTLGTVAEPGFYTVPLSHAVSLEEGREFAVVLWVRTPDCDIPLAIEMPADEESTIILDDGEGYLSPTGVYWVNAEEDQGCNICLKAYASN